MAMCTRGWSVRMGSWVPLTACAARGASSGSNAQPLEDETGHRAVAEERDTRDAQAGERFERRRLESRLVVRDRKEHHDHRHLPLLSCAVQWRGG
jgi:hypothetical protein